MIDPVITHAHESIAVGSKSFALASRIFAPDMRDDAAMLYAWCRYCDDVIDGQDMGHGQIEDYRTGQRERLAFLTSRTRAALEGSALSGEGNENYIFQGLARVFQTHDIPHRHAYELIRGFEMDTDIRHYQTREDILDYCYHVAGVVGVMMAYVMGVREPKTLDRASDLGLAFQLTNIARDVIDDAKAERIYVPEDVLIEAGAPTLATEIAKPENWPANHIAATTLLDMAEQYYDSAKVGIKDLPFRCAWAICAALSVYREIGEILRKGGPTAWERRVGASKGRKLALALGAALPAMARSRVKDTLREKLYPRPVS